MSIVYFSFALAYYSLILLLPQLFESESKHTKKVRFNFPDLAFASSCEIVGVFVAILVVDRIGRTCPQAVLYLTGAVFALGLSLRDINLYILGGIAGATRLCVMSASCLTWVHTPELFPTRVRGTAHALCNFVARFGAFTAAYITNWEGLSDFMHAAIIAAFMFFAGVGASQLPETAGKRLADLEEEN